MSRTEVGVKKLGLEINEKQKGGKHQKKLS